MKNAIFFLSSLLVVAACSPSTPRTTDYDPQPVEKYQPLATPTPLPDPAAPPKHVAEAPIPKGTQVAPNQYQKIILDGGEGQLDFNPKVDILFVEDNSDSMKNKQANLIASIDNFVAGLKKNRMIDYHIGVVTVWDSTRTLEKTYGIGELHHIKDSSGKSLSNRFVARNQAQDLASTLKVGVLSLSQGGPENEELLSPIDAAIHKIGHGDVNEGFFRDDAQLVVVMMTDADDSSPTLTADGVAKELIEFKGGDAKKVSVYGALVSKNDSDSLKDYALQTIPAYHPECFVHATDKSGKDVVTSKRNDKCPQPFGPDKLESFVVQANAGQGTPDQIRSHFIISITQKNFGPDLLRIGSEITAKTLEKDIQLPQRPHLNDNGQWEVWVHYGTEKQLAEGTAQSIPYGTKGGWQYDAANNEIHLSGDIDYQYQDGARFSVEMVPVILN